MLSLAGSWNNILVNARSAALGGSIVAVGGDPASVFFNPAGLAGMRGAWAVDLEGFYVLPEHSYVLAGRPEARSRRDGVTPQAFAAWRPSAGLTLGFGVYLAYASSAVDWTAEETGIPLKSALGIYSFSPAVAYRLSDSLSMGLAVNFYKAGLSLTAELDPFGLIENDESGGAVSASFGFLANPLPRLSLGVCVRSPARMKTSGRTSLEIEGVPLRFSSETSFWLPWDIEAGLSAKFGGRVTASVSAELALWSSLKTLDKVFMNVPLLGDVAVPTAMNYRDILILRAGLEWDVSGAVQARAGFGWDPAAAPEESLTPGNIDVDKRTVSLGCGWRAGRARIDVACGWAFGASRQKKLPETVSGAGETFDLDVFYAGLGIRFGGE
jgi:long-chain fatty acid transport protein